MRNSAGPDDAPDTAPDQHARPRHVAPLRTANDRTARLGLERPQRRPNLTPDLSATEAQMKSTEATPSTVATSTAAVPDAASDQRRTLVPGAASTAAPSRPSVIPTNVSTA